MNPDVKAIAGMLVGDAALCADTLSLAIGECTLQLRSNSAAVIDGLRQYFSHVPAGHAEPDMEVIAIEREAPDTGIDFVDWRREPGKTGRKD
ncbi:MAG TPA: HprK-related kinase B, partial [Gammaproteobacteria bacterium]|nr:HprK-related kinase B [Gammaproteobacteria bacterium]